MWFVVQVHLKAPAGEQKLLVSSLLQMRLTTAVIVELDEEVGALLRCAGVAQQAEEEGARHTSLGPPLGLMLDLLLLTHTACGLPVRKISSQVNSRVFRPRRVVTLTSPVKRLDQNVNLKGSIGWQHRIDEFTNFMASCLKGLVMKSVDSVSPDHPPPSDTAVDGAHLYVHLSLSSPSITFMGSFCVNAKMISFLPLCCCLHPISSLPPCLCCHPFPPPLLRYPLPPLLCFRLTCHWVPCGVMVVVSASHAQSSAETYCFMLGILEQGIDLYWCVCRSFRYQDYDAA